ncbi:MAG: histidine phosphatase family protein [Mobilicoccus sp.]|nr:histidine phosphatase family protein [Mobilicoccus sp.]
MRTHDLAERGDTSGIAELVLIRHGESVGNVADRAAIAAQAHRLDLDARDADVTLSPEGEKQADALADHVADLPDDQRPTIVISSPYRRAHETAERALGELGPSIIVDERIRERELGIFDGVTWYGIEATHPEESARRAHVGKFYYRPPGGESWADVILRVRSIVNEIQQRFHGERVWLFSHEAVILAFRYVLEGLDEHTVLALQKDEPIANCSLTRYRLDAEGSLALVRSDDTEVMEESDAEVTREEPR